MASNELLKQLQAAAGRDGPLALVGFDVDRIQDYVFASNKPIEISGASRIVRDLTEDTVPRLVAEISLPADAVLDATGGSGAVVVPGGAASDLCKSIESRYAVASITGSCTAVHVPVTSAELLADTGFGQVLTRLGRALRERKDRRWAEVPGEQSLPGYVKRCGSCDRYAASCWDDVYPNEDGRAVCATCLAKRRRARDGRDVAGPRQAQTIADIVRRDGREDDRLAALYVDCRNLGAVRESVATPSELGCVTVAVAGAVRAAIDAALATEGIGEGRYLAPVVGGDDMVLFVPARSAVRALRAMRDGFHKSIATAGRPADLKLDAGLLVADAHMPARYLFNYARALMKGAKAAAYARESGEDCIDYALVKGGSPLNCDIRSMRAAELELDTDVGDYLLTCRPYDWPSFEKLIDKATRLASVPRSQLHSALEMLWDHPHVAQLNLAYLAADSSEWKNAMADKSSDDFFVYPVRDLGYRTDYVDALELLELGVEGS